MKTEIKQAPGYSITNDGWVLNDKTKKRLNPSKGSVRLMIDGKRKSFKVSDLLKDVEIKDKKKSILITSNEAKKDNLKEAKKDIAKAVKSAAAKIAVIKSKKAVQDPSIYPYKIKDIDKINEKIKSLSVGDKVTFIDYKTKKKMTGKLVSHSKFSDNYPGARISVGEGKEKKSKILSYLNITKKS
jgi:sugar-specific transcriptional regulator TrmB